MWYVSLSAQVLKSFAMAYWKQRLAALESWNWDVPWLSFQPQLRNGLTNFRAHCRPCQDIVLVELLRFSQAMLWHAPEHPRGYCCDLSTRKFSGATSELEGTSDIHLTEWRSWVGPERFWYVFKCFNSSLYRVNTKCRLAFAVIHLSLLVYTIFKHSVDNVDTQANKRRQVLF